jgi:hypothetical protein
VTKQYTKSVTIQKLVESGDHSAKRGRLELFSLFALPCCISLWLSCVGGSTGFMASKTKKTLTHTLAEEASELGDSPSIKEQSFAELWESRISIRCVNTKPLLTLVFQCLITPFYHKS